MHWLRSGVTKRCGSLWTAKTAGSCTVPAFLPTQATDCALGGNPHYSGNEFLAASFADFAFYARALSDVEIVRLATH